MGIELQALTSTSTCSAGKSSLKDKPIETAFPVDFTETDFPNLQCLSGINNYLLH